MEKGVGGKGCSYQALSSLGCFKCPFVYTTQAFSYKPRFYPFMLGSSANESVICHWALACIPLLKFGKAACSGKYDRKLLISKEREELFWQVEILVY